MNIIAKRKIHSISFICLFVVACNSGSKEQSQKNSFAGKHFEGSFSNGIKGDKISFDISSDGKRLINLTFKGYWRCDGRLESTTAGPKGAYDIVVGKVSDVISESPTGGSTVWHFGLQATLHGTTATGNFRMNINNLGCDTYRLNWTATSN